jgi:transcriptional antiterminator RfaH
MVKQRLFESGERWYCVRTKPKKERIAAANVASMHGLSVFCPQLRFRRKTARGPVWFQEAMFPGYIFARFDMVEMMRAVSYAPGVLNLPVFNNRYVPIPDPVIESLRKDLDETGSVDAGLPLEEGEETTVLEGPMCGLKVKVIKVMPAEDRVAVLLEMLGTLVEAEFPASALEHRTRHKMTAAD